MQNRELTTTTIRFLDLSVDDPTLKRELLAVVDDVLSRGQLVFGPEVEEFEGTVARMCHKKHAVAVSSGSDALYLALRSLGIGPGDEVITTPMGWVATTNAILLAGATPVFVDVREDMNIDESLISGLVTRRAKAILPVHWHGKLCRMDAVSALAQEHRLLLVEDFAQAIAAQSGGRPAGSYGHASALSLNPMKVWGAYGEAGAVVTDDAEVRERLNCLRHAGTVNKEDCHFPALNGKMDTLQAAMLLVNVRRLPGWLARRREIARRYTKGLAGLVRCPEGGDDHAFYTYTVLARNREGLRAHLASRGIESRLRQPFLIPHQTAYRSMMPRPRIPVAERLVHEILSLPMHPKLTDDDVDRVIVAVREFYGADGR